MIIKYLLADAEILEDIPEDFVGGDFADDGTDVVEGLADVLGDKVGRKAGMKTVLDAGQGRLSILQGIDMAGVGDHDIVRRDRIFAYSAQTSVRAIRRSSRPSPFFAETYTSGLSWR